MQARTGPMRSTRPEVAWHYHSEAGRQAGAALSSTVHACCIVPMRLYRTVRSLPSFQGMSPSGRLLVCGMQQRIKQGEGARCAIRSTV